MLGEGCEEKLHESTEHLNGPPTEAQGPTDLILTPHNQAPIQQDARRRRRALRDADTACTLLLGFGGAVFFGKPPLVRVGRNFLRDIVGNPHFH